ncbi:hypothetical protein FRB96_002763 [Tulasnella sp. 330]|nr:hypothetical protein FRB96_002763 [Tulasnella sp. 330]
MSLCDRKKPFCTTCLDAGKECAYVDRKPVSTASELENHLKNLERIYADCLEAKIKKTRNSKASANTDPPYGGYHFDESFLTMSSSVKEVTPLLPKASPKSVYSKDSEHLRLRPSRIFTPVLRTSCVSPTGRPRRNDGPMAPLEDLSVEEKTPAGRPAKRPRLMPSATDASEQWKRAQDNFAAAKNEPQGLERPLTTAFQYFRGTCAPPSIDIGHAPSLHFSRATWWDSLLNTYTIRQEVSNVIISRHSATTEISRDIYFFFRTAGLWLFFFNVPLFFDMFHHKELRASVQPALVLSILAYSKLVQSVSDSIHGLSPEEQERAWRRSVILRDLAQGSMEASYNAGWIDLPLAQAAWVRIYLYCAQIGCAEPIVASATNPTDLDLLRDKCA